MNQECLDNDIVNESQPLGLVDLGEELVLFLGLSIRIGVLPHLLEPRHNLLALRERVVDDFGSVVLGRLFPRVVLDFLLVVIEYVQLLQPRVALAHLLQEALIIKTSLATQLLLWL